MVWDQSYYNIGSSSSPRTVDLNKDGILDVVMGGGNQEMGPTEQGVFAVDGKTGELLWKQKANAQIVGSANFYDITNDDIPDIIIGGRNANLLALDGQTGTPIWSYDYHFESDPILKHARFNFYNSTLVSNKNEIPNLLTINGGNWDAKPGENDVRYPAVLMLFDLLTGEIIAADTMPDRKESYMSPISFKQKNTDVQNVIFGTGGETISGDLYWTTVDDLKNNRLFKAAKIASEKGHGFIAPPVVADINGDAILDVIAISHAAKIFAIDGKTKKTLWTKSFDNLEANSSFAVGYFNEDEIPDFFTILNKGVWPAYTNSTQVLMDGKDGSVIYQDSMGCFGLSSPVAYDLNNDQIDEVIFSVNDYNCDIELVDGELVPTGIKNKIIAIDFKKNFVKPIDVTNEFKNVFSTPWIGDLDQDNYLDLVYCQYFNHGNMMRFLGMRIKRISTSIRMTKPVVWGAYMGSDGKSVFQ